MTYSILTVAHGVDHGLLTLQARSLALYCPADLVHEIVVIENFDAGQTLDWRKPLLLEYGRLASKVRFIPAAEVGPIPPGHGGWWVQQILKITAARVISSPRYLVLDAKNHLTRPLDLSFLETATGVPKLNGYGFEHHSLRDALIRALVYFEIEPEPFVRHFARTSTPYLMLTEVCRDLIRYVETREGVPFGEAFLGRRLTEFFLYAGFLQAQGRLQTTYSMTQPFCPQIWGFSSGLHGVNEALTKARDPASGPFLAVHRLALTEMQMPARAALADFWQEVKLFPTLQAGILFSLYPNR